MLSQRYLIFNERGRAELSILPQLSGELEVHIVARNESKNRTQVSSFIPSEALIRLSHRSTGRYLSLVHGIVILLGTTGDGQVFRMSLAVSMHLELLRSASMGRDTLRILQPQWASQESPNISHLFKPIADFTETFSTYIFDRGQHQLVQDTLTYLHLPIILLDVAHNVFLAIRSTTVESEPNSNPLAKMIESKEQIPMACLQLIMTVYSLLELLIRGNAVAAEVVLSAPQGVQRMIEQQLFFEDVESLSALRPPLLTLLEASKLRHENSNLLSRNDITLLMDHVFRSIELEKVPGQFPYSFLSQVCEEGSPELQLLVCRQLLGAASHSNKAGASPFWSAMVYRTYLHDETSTLADISSPSTKGKGKVRLLISTW